MKKLYDPKDIAEKTGVAKQEIRKLLYEYEDVVKPVDRKNNSVVRKGYKQYDDDAVDKVRQILIYKELGLKHNGIKAIFSSPTYDPNQALAEQLNALKEKRKQINRQIEAVEQMQALGVKNGILPLIFPDGSAKKFFESDYSEITQRITQRITPILEPILEDDARWEEFFSQIEPIMAAYAKLDDCLCEAEYGMALLEKLVSKFKEAFGFWGYVFLLCVVGSVHGEGTTWRDINEAFENPLTIQKYQAILQWILNDWKSFDSELRSLARQYNCIGLRFEHKRSISFIEDVKAAAKKHFALESNEEYSMLLSVCHIQPYKRGGGYALYTLNALKNAMDSQAEKQND